MWQRALLSALTSEVGGQMNEKWAASIIRCRIAVLIIATVLPSIYVTAQQTPQKLHQHVPPIVRSGQADFVGKLPAAQTVDMAITLPLRNQPGLTNLLKDLYDPTSPRYRQFLTVEEFTEQFGPSVQDYETVIQWANSQGFAIRGTSKNRLVLDVSGTAAQVNAALNVSINQYRDPKEDRTFYSVDREPTLNLEIPIAHIQGLNNYSIPQPMHKRIKNGTPIANATGSGPGGSYLASDMRTAYYGSTLLTGAGQCVGLFQFGGYRLSDVNLTFANAGQSYSVPINNVLVSGASASAGSDDSEQVLDIVQAIGMAPGLNQVRVYIGTPGNDASIFNAMASENVCKQLGVSWSWTPDDPWNDDSIFEEFAAQGQSVFVASGDDGAYDEPVSPYFYPAEDVYITAVGGTHLETSYAGGPWAVETAWNNPPYGSAGGISPDNFPIPSWQQGVATSSNSGSLSLRNVPDVAMEADLDNYICDLGTCAGGAGGTSFAAPRWAGFMALINQQATEAGTAPKGGIGFLNPMIYSIGAGGNYTTDFHDITSGNNDTNNQPVWYNAVTGYDLVTGWGSPSGQSLIDALAGPLVSGFWLSESPTSFSVSQGSSVTTTVSVEAANGFAGNVSLTASGLPTGVTASFNPSTTGGTSVLTLTTTSSATLGAATITITGTSGTLSARTSLFLTVNSVPVLPPPMGALGSVNIGTTTSATTETVTFTTAGTLGSISVLTKGISNLDFANAGGGTCTIGTAYAANATCTVKVTFSPKYAGTRLGAVVLADASGNTLAKLYLAGTGIGPQRTFSPGIQVSIGSGFTAQEAAATLGDGSIYVTDYGTGGVGVLYLEKFANGTYTQSNTNCTLKSPTGIAVDGSGTVYVADPGVPAVYKITFPNGMCTETSIGSGFGAPWGLAVDANGDVYIGDLGSTTISPAVYKETLQANGTYVQSTVGSGWVVPWAMAVDGNGNLDVADNSIPGVFMETPSGGSYTQTPIGTGWTAPSGVAIDGGGNIYVSDQGSSVYGGQQVPAAIYKEVSSQGSYSQSMVATGWVVPRGIALDARGNLYVPDQTRGVFKLDLTDTPVLGFANAAQGTTSSDSPKTATISNIGTASLGFTSLAYPVDFPEAPGIPTDCTLSTALPASANCTLSIQFLPLTALGSNSSLALNESVSMTTNSLNTTTPEGIAVSGTEVLGTGAVTLSVSSNPTALGTPLTFTVTASGRSGGPATTGTVTIYNGSTSMAGPLSLNNGVATYTTSALSIGTYSVSASYSGDANYLASNSNALAESIVAPPGASGFGNTSIPNQNVGSASGVIPLTITFSTSETLGSISVLTAGAPNLDFLNAGGGTCSIGTAYTANTSCTVNITFTPRYSGTRNGAVVLYDNNGNVIATGYLKGTGIGPQVSFLPGTLSSIGSGFSYPQGTAVDEAGNVYIADAGNAVVYKEIVSNGTYTQSTLGSGFSQPYAVAVDGAGNVYVADAQNHAVYEEIPGTGTYSQIVVGSGFITPMGVAVDAVGDIYIADAGNSVTPGAVYLLTPSNGTYTQATIGSGFVTPQAIAVDGSGKVYVGDSANGGEAAAVYELAPSNGNYTQTVIGAGWVTPTGVGVDGNGNVYVTDDAFDLGTGFVLKETLQSDGSFLQSTVLSSASTPYPGGVALDGRGNLYVSDNLDGIVYRDDLSDPPAVSFAATVFGAMSGDSPQTVAVQNAGNSTLTFSGISYPADFPEAAGISGDCTATSSLGVGTGCTLSIDFKPATPDGSNQPIVLSENVTVTTNSLNVGGTAQSIVASGTERASMATAALSAPSNVATVGTSVTLTATVTGQSGIATPTGSVTFNSNGSVLGTAPLTNGTATYSVTFTSLGTSLITATYSGDQNYLSVTSNSITEQIIPVSTFGTQNIGNSSSQTLTVTFTAKITLGSIAVVTQGMPNLDFTNAGGTCANGKAYNAGGTCTVSVAFKPRFSGARYGAVVLGDNKGNLIQTIYLEGTGVGPQVQFAPGSQSAIISGSSAPTGPFVVDGNGNIYGITSSSSSTYAVTKWTLSGSTYTASTVPTSFSPNGYVAVDGGGNVYVSIQTNGKRGAATASVYKEALIGGSYKESQVFTETGFYSDPIAVDATGNVYIADSNHNNGGSSYILKETLSNGTYTQSQLSAGFFYQLFGICVDGSGNLYVRDYYDAYPFGTEYFSRVLQLIPLGGTNYSQIAVASTTNTSVWYGSPALDGNGNVYFIHEFLDTNANHYVNELLKATPSLSGISVSPIIPVNVLQGPQNSLNSDGPIGVDGSQNILVLASYNGGSGNEVVKFDLADPQPISFLPTTVGLTSTDSPKMVEVANTGNAPLIFPPPSVGTNPSASTGFSVSSSTSCPEATVSGRAGSLNPNNSCNYGVNFQPTQTGTINGSLIMTDNALNTAGGTQTIPLSGTGTAGSGGNYKVQIAVLTVGANGTKKLTWVPAGAQLSSALASEAKEWADAYNQNFMIGIAEFEQGTCNEIGPGTLSKNSDLLNGQWYFPANPYESYLLPDGSCPGNLYPFAVARYTWNASKQSILEDPVVLNWTDPYGQPAGTISFLAELGHLANDHAVWNVCGDKYSTLPTTATLSLKNPPSNATSYEWTIAAPQNKMTFSNGQNTITTTTPSTTIKGMDASGARNDITFYVEAKGVPFSSGLKYGPFSTWIRRPNQLQLLSPNVFGAVNDGNTKRSQANNTTGYMTNVFWQVNDQFGGNTFNTNQAEVDVTEQLSEMSTPSYSSYPGNLNDWQFGADNANHGYWSPSLCDPNTGQCFYGGTFVDFLGFVVTNGDSTFFPTPQFPPLPGDPYNTQLVTIATQNIYAGDAVPGTNSGDVPAPYQGCRVQTDTMNFGIDHANENPITSPFLPQPVDNVALAITAGVGTAPKTSVQNVVVDLEDSGTMMVPAGASSALGAVADVGFLEKRSSVIVKGTVLETEASAAKGTNSTSSSEMSATIQVDSALKGSNVGNAITIKYSVEPGRLGIWLEKGEYALFFLTNPSDGTYRFVDPVNSRMPITRQPVSAGVDSTSPFGELEAELAASLADPDRRVAHAALTQIGNLGHGEYGIKPNLNRSTIRALEQIAVSSDPESRGLAFADLIKLQNYALLKPAIDFAQSDLSNGGGIIGAINEIGDLRLREAKRAADDPDMECPSRSDVSFDRSVLPVLHSLLASGNPDLRRSAAHALRGICDPSSASILAEALNDNDPRIQYDALQGLAAMEDFPADRPAPATSDFNGDPPRYLNIWRSWWGTVGIQKYEMKR